MVRSLEADRDQVIGHHGRCRRVARLAANANAEDGQHENNSSRLSWRVETRPTAGQPESARRSVCYILGLAPERMKLFDGPRRLLGCAKGWCLANGWLSALCWCSQTLDPAPWATGMRTPGAMVLRNLHLMPTASMGLQNLCCPQTFKCGRLERSVTSAESPRAPWLIESARARAAAKPCSASVFPPWGCLSLGGPLCRNIWMFMDVLLQSRL